MTVLPFPSVGRAPTPESISDAALVAAAQGGDRRAQERLYRRHAPGILDALSRLNRDSHDVEDAVHDAFLHAFGALEQLAAPSQFRPWVMRAALRRVSRGRWRRQWLRAFVREPGADRRQPLAPPDAAAELRQVMNVVAALPEAQRVAWSLRFVEGYTLPDAAVACGCSLATVKRRIAAAQRAVVARAGVDVVLTGPGAGASSDAAVEVLR